jgi:uroporphyrinogen decarboxylase
MAASPSPRDNLLALWRRQGIHHAPVCFTLCPDQLRSFRQRYGADAQPAEQFAFPFRYLPSSFLRPRNQDWQRFFPGKRFDPRTRFSIWGVGEEPADGSRHITRMHHPMAEFSKLQEFQAYPYPDFDPSQLEQARAEVEALHARGLAAAAGMACTVWEIGWYLRGMEKLMIDLLTEEPCGSWHLDHLCAIACQRAQAFAQAGVDMLCLGDDIGMQKSTMISMDNYRQWLKPRHAAVIQAAKNVKPDILVTYHSCGYIEPFIPELIEIGVDVLDPVQPECMDFASIHAQYGSRLSFWGSLGTQSTMPFASPEEVRRVTLHNLSIAGEQGGLFCSPTHMIEPEVPWENIEAYVQAARDFRPRQ